MSENKDNLQPGVGGGGLADSNVASRDNGVNVQPTQVEQEAQAEGAKNVFTQNSASRTIRQPSHMDDLVRSARENENTRSRLARVLDGAVTRFTDWLKPNVPSGMP